MFSISVEYALRAMVALALRYNEPLTVKQISKATQVPRPYLSKVMHNLARAELVRSQRGLGGGFVLSRAPEEITILDVVNAVDAIKHRGCPSEKDGATCPLHRLLDQALDAIDDVRIANNIAKSAVMTVDNSKYQVSTPIINNSRLKMNMNGRIAVRIS